MAYPTTIDTFTTHVDGDTIDPAYDNAQQTAIVALETKLGIDNSADATSINYKLISTLSIDVGHKHNLAVSINDVVITNVQDTEVLTYDAGTGKWVNGNPVAVPDASTTTKGITKISVAPASATSPIAVGDNDPRVPTQSENDALVGNNTDIAVGTGNKMVTQTGLQKNAEKYGADGGANDTYVITLSPVPTSYTTGMVVHFKANTANTGACTLNVNSLGAKTIIKGLSTTLIDGDIGAGMLCTVIYDGTNFVLQNPVNITQYVSVVSDNLKISADTERQVSASFGGLSMNIKKQIKMPFSGSARVYFEAKDPSGSSGRARIYMDGVAVGTMRSPGTSYVAYTEDINQIKAGSIMQLAMEEGLGNTTAIKNFRIYYDLADGGFGYIVSDSA